MHRSRTWSRTFLAWTAGVEAALKTTVPAMLGAAMFAFVFFRAMREPLLP